MATNARDELLAATKIKPKAKEDEVELATRVATYISDKMSEEDYNALSKGAHSWYEKVVAASEAEEDTPALPNGAAAPAKKAAAAKEAPAAKKAASKKTAAKKVPEKPGVKVSASDLMRVLCCKHQNLALADIMAKLEEKGCSLNPTAAGDVYRTVHRTIEVLTEMGKLK